MSCACVGIGVLLEAGVSCRRCPARAFKLRDRRRAQVGHHRLNQRRNDKNDREHPSGTDEPARDGEGPPGRLPRIHLLKDEPDVLVATRCPACDTPHAWVVGREAPPRGDQVAHFLIPMRRAWDDVVRTCGNQRLFCSTDCVDTWLRRTGHERGYVMDLATLWRFASDWYTGRLDPGYTRRDPASAGVYFAEVGLHGSFWGLPD
ncbi:organomercurial lyase [Streptomyces sp. NPDC048337]|uniref:organomercurial lyase n=1 Tax=Streptomyces sp. NPDC048337 TaxID=3365535 RepID=UPI00371711AB